MAATDRFPNLFIGEKKVLAFDFSYDLRGGATLTGTPVVEITVLSGTDGVPADLANGAAVIVGEYVLLPVDPLLEDVDYRIKVLVDTSNAQLRPARIGRLYVES